MLTLAKIFQNGMTLQRQKPVRLWGESDQPQTLRIALNGAEIATAQVETGPFQIILPPQPACESANLALLGSSGDQIIFADVDIGEVWVAGGQSNMEFMMLQDAEGKALLANANDPHLRFYDVPKWAFAGEEAEGVKDASFWGHWLCWQPKQAGRFTAVGAWFALQLRQILGVPVALVGCNWGGTSASAWMDEAILKNHPQLKEYCESYEVGLKGLDLGEYEAFRKQKAAYSAAPVSGEPMDMNELIKKAAASGLLEKMRRMLDTIGPKSENRPGALYETMVKTIAGYSCQGVLWYQGESDDKRAALYNQLFSQLIGCWRKAFEQKLPFLFVQLAPFGRWGASTGALFPALRAAQEQVSKTVPDVWMASIMDAGEELDIHPTHKKPVGERLALLARGKVYGEAILCDPPEFDTVTLTDGTLTLHFRHAGEGLMIEGSEITALEFTANGAPVQSFTVKARGSALALCSPALRPGVAMEVRFAQTGYCRVNLYSSAGLPAKPFSWHN